MSAQLPFDSSDSCLDANAIALVLSQSQLPLSPSQVADRLSAQLHRRIFASDVRRMLYRVLQPAGIAGIDSSYRWSAITKSSIPPDATTRRDELLSTKCKSPSHSHTTRSARRETRLRASADVARIKRQEKLANVHRSPEAKLRQARELRVELLKVQHSIFRPVELTRISNQLGTTQLGDAYEVATGWSLAIDCVSCDGYHSLLEQARVVVA